jgi:hypothetical protein
MERLPISRSTAMAMVGHKTESTYRRYAIVPAEALADAGARRLAVLPTWVRQQLEDVAGLLQDAPERARNEFERLGLRFTLHPVLDGPEGVKPFLRAVGEGEFHHLSGEAFPTTGASLPQSAS